MKKIFLLFFIFFGKFCVADVDGCLMYKIKVTLKDGEKSEGYFYYVVYDAIPVNFSKDDFNNFFVNYLNEFDTISVYLNIQQLNYPRFDPGLGSDSVLHAVVKNDRIKITEGDFKAVEYLGFRKCDSPFLIEDITQNEIEMLKKQPLVIHNFSLDKELPIEYYAVSFNKEILIDSLKAIENNLVLMNSKLENIKDEINFNKKYELYRSDLLKSDVILLCVTYFGD